MVPDVLIDAQGSDPGEAGLVLIRGIQQRPDRVPHGVPGRAQPARQPVHRCVLPAHLGHGPPACSCRQQGLRTSDPLVLLHERALHTVRVRAQPTALAPGDPYRSPERRRVDQHDVHPAVTDRHDTTHRAPHDPRRGLHHDLHAAAVPVAAIDLEHMQARQINQQITPTAIAARYSRAAQRRLGHRRGPRGRRCGSPLILGGLDPIPGSSKTHRRVEPPTVKCEEPLKASLINHGKTPDHWRSSYPQIS